MNKTTIRDTFQRFLSWSGRHIKTDMNYVASGSFWSFLGQFSASGTSFLLSIAFANLISPADYGNYKYLLTLGEIMGYFALSGVAGAIIPAVARGKDGVLRSGFWMNLRWSAISILFALGGAVYYWHIGRHDLAYGLIIIGATAPLMRSGSLSSAFLHGKKDFRRKTLYEIGRTFISASAMATALFLTNNALALVSTFYIVNTIASLLFYFLTLHVYHPPKTHDTDTVRYAKHLSVNNVFGIISDQIDSILVYHFLGPANLAIYSFATAVPDQIRNFFKRIHSLALPKFAKKEPRYVHRAVMKKILPGAVILIPITIGYMVFAPFVYRVFFPQYEASIPYSQFYAIIFLLYMNLSSQALNAKQAVKEIYIMNIFSSISRIALMFILGIGYGMWGIIIGQIVAKFLTSILSLFLVQKLKHLPQTPPTNT